MTCVAIEVPLTIYEGGTFKKSFIWKSGDPPTPVDITGYGGRGAIRSKLTDDTVLLDISFQADPWNEDGDTGLYIGDSSISGEFMLYLRDDDTIGICPSHKNISGVYDLFLENDLGESVLKLYGTASLIAAVKRSV